MHKLLTAGVALLALGLSVPAKAADMPVKYVAPAPVFTWTGCYVGVHIGYKWGTSSHEYGGLQRRAEQFWRSRCRPAPI